MAKTTKNALLSLLEYEGKQLEAKDVRQQNQACREYFEDTPPAAWSYSGWLEYWETSERNPLNGAPMHISEARFNELRAAVAPASAPAPGRPGRKKQPAPTEAEKAAAVKACRNKIKETEAFKEAVLKGYVTEDFKWNRDGETPLLWSWLIENNIASQRANSIAWNIEDGTFTDKAGNPITKASLSASKSAKQKI